ncbi:cell division protein ZapA [Limibaculum sp. M0105]|uniref:Cell division protein ZapA n=1 Tax=Thermohalobaculum xanthum TaxID=2753746 RepID=A0A8J7SEQ8_9RHOB|nr:cell division protein ZapA [Thermohalobaculum xanthum]MBK0398015.1 cell division protein ZapA [Thermohalobaculum xanthum]
MAEVTVDVGGRSYRLACENGEEEHLAALCARIDAEARRLARGMGQMPEGRLMLMSALMVADRLHDAEKEIAALGRKLSETKKQAEQRDAGSDLFSKEREASLESEIADLAARLEALAEVVTPAPSLPLDGGGS